MFSMFSMVENSSIIMFLYTIIMVENIFSMFSMFSMVELGFYHSCMVEIMVEIMVEKSTIIFEAIFEAEKHKRTVN